MRSCLLLWISIVWVLERNSNNSQNRSKFLVVPCGYVPGHFLSQNYVENYKVYQHWDASSVFLVYAPLKWINGFVTWNPIWYMHCHGGEWRQQLAHISYLWYCLFLHSSDISLIRSMVGISPLKIWMFNKATYFALENQSVHCLSTVLFPSQIE